MRTLMVVCAAALVALLVHDVRAQGCGPRGKTAGCEKGGCEDKVCQLVTSTKEVKKTVYACERDCVCLPPPSRICGSSCDGKCGGGCKDVVHDRCGKVRPIKKLVKYEITEKVCSYKWVVVSACGAGCGGAAVPAGASEPIVKPAPATARLGDELPLSKEELQRVKAQPASYTKADEARGTTGSKQVVKNTTLTVSPGDLGSLFKPAK